MWEEGEKTKDEFSRKEKEEEKEKERKVSIALRDDRRKEKYI